MVSSSVIVVMRPPKGALRMELLNRTWKTVTLPSSGARHDEIARPRSPWQVDDAVVFVLLCREGVVLENGRGGVLD